jgi:hypothetical protein
MKEDDLKIEKVHCNKCLRSTKHYLIAERIEADQECVNEANQIYINWSTTSTMLECCGCANVTLRKKLYFSEWDDIEIQYYPPAISRQLPKWHHELPREINELLKEIYTALHADSRRLALMGARTIVDLFMADQVGDIGGFTQKLEELEKKGFVSKKHREILEAALEAGHAAAHRGHQPKQDEVAQVIDIVENLIQIYVLKKSAEDLKSKIPPRNKLKH